MAYRISREFFEELVRKAVDMLPEEFRSYFTNITIIVKDYPDKEDAMRLYSDKHHLLGLFSGVPYPRKRGFFNVDYPLPDQIILFQRNIENRCSSEKELIKEIQKTVVHEVGHYFGLSEEELRKYE